MFIELEDLDGRPLFFVASEVKAIGAGFCTVDGIRYEVNHTSDEILRVVNESLRWGWEHKTLCP